ncbi:unnamed protein product, partial [Prorocentrum cordatum]
PPPLRRIRKRSPFPPLPLVQALPALPSGDRSNLSLGRRARHRTSVRHGAVPLGAARARSNAAARPRGRPRRRGDECTVPGACLDEAAVEAAEQGEADALRVELLQSRSSVAARASTESNASSGASSDRTFWFVSRKQCGGVAGVPGNVLWAAQCQPAAWDRTKSVIYMCEGREATNTLHWHLLPEAPRGFCWSALGSPPST